MINEVRFAMPLGIASSPVPGSWRKNYGAQIRYVYFLSYRILHISNVTVVRQLVFTISAC